MERTSRIIDDIYAAALDASAWPALTRTMCSLYDCRSAGVYAADEEAGQVRILGVEGIGSGHLDSYVEHFLRDNPWTNVPALQRPGVIRTDRSLDRHHRRPGYYRRTALFNEWMKPQDFVFTLGTNLLAEPNALFKFFMYRPADAAPFSEAEIQEFRTLSGHLANAIRVMHRLELAEARSGATQHVLDSLQIGAVFLDSRGRLLHANGFAARLMAAREGLVPAGGTVTAARAADARRLAAALRAALDLHHGRTVDAPRMVGVGRPGRRPLRVVATPLPRVADAGPWRACRAAVVLIVTDPELEPAISGEWLRQRYGLTPAESGLAQRLMRGASLREAADGARLSYETARWYLKNIFQKTGTRRQSDLIRLLLSEQLLLES